MAVWFASVSDGVVLGVGEDVAQAVFSGEEVCEIHSKHVDMIILHAVVTSLVLLPLDCRITTLYHYPPIYISYESLN